MTVKPIQPILFSLSGQGNIKYLNLSNVLSESDKTSQSLIYSSVEKMDQFYGIIEHEYYYNDDKTHPTDSFFPVSIAFVNS